MMRRVPRGDPLAAFGVCMHVHDVTLCFKVFFTGCSFGPLCTIMSTSMMLGWKSSGGLRDGTVDGRWSG